MQLNVFISFVFFFSQMKSPGITTTFNGKNKTLYMQTVKSIEEKTRENLKKTLGGKNIYNTFFLECNGQILGLRIQVSFVFNLFIFL